jgi:hypothetical protein
MLDASEPPASVGADIQTSEIACSKVGGKLVTRQEVKARAAGPWAADIKL